MSLIADVGGPAMVYNVEEQRYELVGIASFRTTCTDRGLFTRITPYITWINEVLENPPPTDTPIPTIAPPRSTTPTTTIPDILGR